MVSEHPHGNSLPLIANQYHDQQTNQVKRARYRLIARSDLAWLKRDRLQEVKAGLAAEHKWIPVQNLPFRPTQLIVRHIRMPGVRIVQGAYRADWHRPALNRKSCPCQVLMDGGYIQHYQSPATYHAPKKRQFRDRSCYTVRCGTNPVARRRSLATAAKNQAEDGPNTRRAAVRACKYLRAHTQPI